MPDLLERLNAALAGRYAIESEIGRGGMATVYLAHDLRHDRRVAMKVLHPELAASVGADRFLSEIKIVAGLQHPHILPLYDSGEADGLLWFVMPYSEGESLRQRLDRQRQLAVDESIRIAIEVADGLDYAHRQGVVHRDIKPGNILLAEGHATIADFGIARAIEAAKDERVTTTGIGVGTPLYASPEQATGDEALDGRTDVYSLGCVLYEMLAGEPPLSGSTPKMIQARRMSETPTPLNSLRDTVPPALDHAIARALARVPADRYASAAEFGKALQAVLVRTTPVEAVQAPATGEHTIPPPGTHSVWRVGVPAVLVAGLLAAALWWLPSLRTDRGPLQITVSSTADVSSEPGVEYLPAISPDGGEVAYVEGHSGDLRISVRSAIAGGGGGGLRPAEDAGGMQILPGWTAGGQAIRYCSYVFPACDWKEVGRLGGFVQALDEPRSWNLSWSPDGTRAALAAQESLFVWSPGDSMPRLLGVHPWPAWRPTWFTWSPDGRRIAYVNSNPFWAWGPNVAPSSIWVIDAAGGEPIAITNQDHLNVSPQWMPDNRHLLFVSNPGGARGIYVVEVGSEGAVGEPRSVLPSSDAHSISLSADGTKLAYSRFIARQNIWSVPIPESGVVSIREATPITTGNQVIEDHKESPDGEWIAYASRTQGQFDIYKMRLEGGPPQLLADVQSHAYEPRWSPDGTEIAFFSFDGEILLVSADGGSPSVVADFPGFEGGARWSPDGLSIAFESEGPQAELPNKLWVVSRDSIGGPWSDPTQLTEFGCGSAEWFADGDSILCEGRRQLVRVATDGTVLERRELPERLRGFSPVRFSPDGSRIYFRASHEDGRAGVWWIPVSGGPATLVVAFDDPSLDVQGQYLSVGQESVYVTIAQNESDIRVVDLEW